MLAIIFIFYGKTTLWIILDFYHPNFKSYKLNMLTFHQEVKENRETKTSLILFEKKNRSIILWCLKPWQCLNQ